MKKVFILIFMVFLAVVAFGQRTAQMPSNRTYLDTRIASTDVVTNAAAVTFTLVAERHMPYTYDVRIKLDSIKTPNVSVQLKGKKFADDAWTNIGSPVVWALSTGTQPDTTFTISATTAVRWRYLGVTATGTGTQGVGFNSLEWKLWEED